MELSTAMSVFSVGAAGGIAAELLHWWNLRTSKRWPRYASHPRYWLLTLAMIALGGFVCWLQFGQAAEASVAFQIGLAAPVVLQKLAVSAPQPAGAMTGLAAVANWRDFFTW